MSLLFVDSKVVTRCKYAPISGSVEPSDLNPLSAAWRELREETGLTSSSLRLLYQGKPYSFSDESAGREWVINPFAFVLKPSSNEVEGEAEFRLDWEHDSYNWFDPQEIVEQTSFKGVPRLLESLRRVWPEIDMGREAASTLKIGLQNLQNDRHSGARQLASASLNIFFDVISKLDAGCRVRWWKNARFAGWFLWKNGRQSMSAPILAAILSSLSRIETKLSTEGSKLSAEFITSVLASIRTEVFIQDRDSGLLMVNSFATLFRHLVSSVSGRPIRILSLSYSTSVISCIERALSEDYDVHISILESRPLYEGFQMATTINDFARMSGFKAKVEVCTDASVAITARNVDIVLIGADIIDRTGNVSNKTGSLPAVLAANHVSPGAKIIVISERAKILPVDVPDREENDPYEITKSWDKSGVSPNNLEVKNIYFEWVPAGLIDIYLTEGGPTTIEAIANWADLQLLKVDHFFSQL